MAKAKFDIKTEAARPLYAGVGAADLAVETVREYLAEVQAKAAGVQKDVTSKVTDLQKTVTTKATDVQKNVTSFDYKPAALREQATGAVNARVEALASDAKARRAAVEARVTELQGQAKALPTKVQTLVNENVATVNSTYADLAKRGEVLVGKIRKSEAAPAPEAEAPEAPKAPAAEPAAKKPAAKKPAAKKPAAKKTTGK